MLHWTTETQDGIVTAMYHNPPMNYFTASGVTELLELIESWRAPAIRVVVLTGGVPGRFITHYSVEEIATLAADLPALAALGTGLNTGYYELLRRLRELPKPVIAAINGDCMGGGFELCMACDIRILSGGNHRVGLPETRLGIIPGGSGTQALARLIGSAKALEFILRGRIVDPATAHSIGLVHEVTNDATTRALAVARDLAAESPLAMAMAKQAILRGIELPLADALMVEAEASVATIRSPEALRRMREYLAVPLEQRRDWLDRAD